MSNDKYPCFGGDCCLHLQCNSLVFEYPVDGDNRLFRKVDTYLQTYATISTSVGSSDTADITVRRIGVSFAEEYFKYISAFRLKSK